MNNTIGGDMKETDRLLKKHLNKMFANSRQDIRGNRTTTQLIKRALVILDKEITNKVLLTDAIRGTKESLCLMRAEHRLHNILTEILRRGTT